MQKVTFLRRGLAAGVFLAAVSTSVFGLASVASAASTSPAPAVSSDNATTAGGWDDWDDDYGRYRGRYHHRPRWGYHHRPRWGYHHRPRWGHGHHGGGHHGGGHHY